MMKSLLLILALLFLGCASTHAYDCRRAAPYRPGQRSIVVPNNRTYHYNYFNPFYHPYNNGRYDHQYQYKYQYNPHRLEIRNRHYEFDLHW